VLNQEIDILDDPDLKKRKQPTLNSTIFSFEKNLSRGFRENQKRIFQEISLW
jgi:hypothetical protein